MARSPLMIRDATSDRMSTRAPAAAPRLAAAAADELALRRLEAILAAGGRAPTECLTDPEALSPDTAPDVLVLGCGRGVSSRDSLLERLRRKLPDTRVVVVCPRDSRASVRSAVEAGADGVVFDTGAERALVPAVNAVHAGQACVPADQRLEIDRPTLSAREKQILGLVVMGLTNKEIAARLFVAQSTVKCHLSSVFQKLGVRSRHEAVTLILDPNSNLGLGILGLSQSASSGS
jgi:DNA-binding NarL/FixJ family response regulator